MRCHFWNYEQIRPLIALDCATSWGNVGGLQYLQSKEYVCYCVCLFVHLLFFSDRFSFSYCVLWLAANANRSWLSSFPNAKSVDGVAASTYIVCSVQVDILSCTLHVLDGGHLVILRINWGLVGSRVDATCASYLWYTVLKKQWKSAFWHVVCLS